MEYTIPNPTRDCSPAVNPDGSGHINIPDPGAKELHEGDELAILHLTPTGPQPDVNVRPHISGKAVIGRNRWDLIPALHSIGATCLEVLREFESIL
jgi:hypothetical protein